MDPKTFSRGKVNKKSHIKDKRAKIHRDRGYYKEGYQWEKPSDNIWNKHPARLRPKDDFEYFDTFNARARANEKETLKRKGSQKKHKLSCREMRELMNITNL